MARRTSSSFSGLRLTSTRPAPARAKLSAKTRPMHSLAPVTTIRRSSSRKEASGSSGTSLIAFCFRQSVPRSGSLPFDRDSGALNDLFPLFEIMADQFAKLPLREHHHDQLLVGELLDDHGVLHDGQCRNLE